ncbi:MAG TPA: hypothetical protein VL691_04850 [Vicinamibacteria bacterium]|nr:hypothetical protein [Vicinamibacteria bacterium]
MNDDGTRTGEAAATRPDGRLPYEKPAVVWEQPLETQPSLMITCAKQPGAEGDCSAVGSDPSS